MTARRDDVVARHPGQPILYELQKKFRNQHAAALALGVSDSYLSDVLGTRRDLSVRLAIKLQDAGVGTAEEWLVMQMRHDIWKERRDGLAVTLKPKARKGRR